MGTQHGGPFTKYLFLCNSYYLNLPVCQNGHGTALLIHVTGNPTVLNIFRTNFENNFVGFFLQGSTGTGQGAPNTNFDNCVFRTTSQLPPLCGSLDPTLLALSNNTFTSSKGFAGIVAVNSSNISILPSNSLVFDNLANGIWYENSSTGNVPAIKNSHFSNIGQVAEYGESSGNGIILRHNMVSLAIPSKWTHLACR